MAVSNDGKFVVTGSHDKSMRLWEKTNEPLVLDDERENVCLFLGNKNFIFFFHFLIILIHKGKRTRI